MLPLYWAIAGVILIISEFFIPGFVIFFFGAGALLNALLTVVIQALRSNIPVQVLIWLGFSGLSLFTLRKYFSKIFTASDEEVGRFFTIWTALEKKMTAYGTEIKQRNVSAVKAIEILFQREIVNQNDYKQLNGLRKFRNELIHQGKEYVGNVIGGKTEEAELLLRNVAGRI